MIDDDRSASASALDVLVLSDTLSRHIDRIGREHAVGLLLSRTDAALLLAVARCWRSMILADRRPFGASVAERAIANDE